MNIFHEFKVLPDNCIYVNVILLLALKQNLVDIMYNVKNNIFWHCFQ